MLATVVNQVLVPSAVCTRPRSVASTWPVRRTSRAAVEIVAGDVELAGEVVAGPERDDAEHATLVGGDAREHADGAVAPARGDGAPATERVARPGHEVGGIGREHDLEVEIDGGERVEHVGEAGPGPTAPGRRVHDRGPALGGREHRGVRRSVASERRRSVEKAAEWCEFGSVREMTAAADVDLHQVPGHVAVVGGGVDEASLADVVDGALEHRVALAHRRGAARRGVG